MNLDDLKISFATAHCVRDRECEGIKEETLENFRTALEEDPGVPPPNFGSVDNFGNFLLTGGPSRLVLGK